jgi:hypothetical protein
MIVAGYDSQIWKTIAVQIPDGRTDGSIASRDDVRSAEGILIWNYGSISDRSIGHEWSRDGQKAKRQHDDEKASLF